MIATLIAILDLFGVAVFAVTGALVASRKQMDIVGFALLATVTGIGGGTLRDLLLGFSPVFWVHQPIYVADLRRGRGAGVFHRPYPGIALPAAALARCAGPFVFLRGRGRQGDGGGDRRCSSPSSWALSPRPSAGWSAMCSAGKSRSSCARKSTLRRRWRGRPPSSAALMAGLPTAAATFAGFAICLVIRGLALQRGWSLPVYRARPGRSPDEIDRR